MNFHFVLKDTDHNKVSQYGKRILTLIEESSEPVAISCPEEMPGIIDGRK